jgi:hypothetical protein
LVNSACRAERNNSTARILSTEVNTNLRQVGLRAGGLEVGNLSFQSIDPAAAKFRIFDSVFRVGFKSLQELPQSDKVRIGRGF